MLSIISPIATFIAAVFVLIASVVNYREVGKVRRMLDEVEAMKRRERRYR